MDDIPSSFICPLSREVMQDPVVDPEGNTYERAQIEEWLKRNNTSPLTRNTLYKYQLTPNRALKDLIEDFKRGKGNIIPTRNNSNITANVIIEKEEEERKKKEELEREREGLAQAEVVQVRVTSSPITKSATTISTNSDASIGTVASPKKIKDSKWAMIKNYLEKDHGKLDSSKFSIFNTKGDKDNGKDNDNNGDHYVLVEVEPPAGSTRTPVDICCVIDISGSMGSEATMKSAGGANESFGLTLLDVVKHAVKTIGHSLQAQDRLAVVTYSTNAAVISELTYMNEGSTKALDDKLDALEPDGRTNIWDGLQTGLELLRKEKKTGRVASLLLLTDGWPNVSPPRGEVAMFKKYQETYKLPCVVSTFGFGYELNSELLNLLAIEGNGMFSFIPDSSFVGTAFVNAASNLLVTMGTNVSLSLEPQNGASVLGVLGPQRVEIASWGALMHLPSLQYGQTLCAVVKMHTRHSLANDKPFLKVTLKFDHWGSSKQVQTTVIAANRDGPSEEICVQRRRLAVVDYIKKLMDAQKATFTKTVKSLLDELTADLQEGTDPREQGLLGDVTGQITEAVSKPEYFEKWGGHYLPSLSRAHLLQQCNNFKDVGIQFYGGELFKKIRDEIDDIFCNLPPPVVRSFARNSYSSFNYSSNNSYSAPSNPQPQFSMAVFNSSSNPCFDGNCSVLMADGNRKKVQNIARGDRVATLKGREAEVLCVVKTICYLSKAELVEIEGGLLVTPYHPIKINGEWRFPRDVNKVMTRHTPAVYSFVLKENSEDHVMIINGVECVTLGHKYTGSVVGHPYFGSHAVVDDLSQMRGFQECGVVELRTGCLVRHNGTGLVCHLSEQRQQLKSSRIQD